MKEMFIFGAGGYAREVFFVAGACGWSVRAFVDTHSAPALYGTPVIAEDDLGDAPISAVVALGDSQLRRRVVRKLAPRQITYVTLIHPSAQIMSADVTIGEGSVVSPNCVLTCDIQLGAHTQLNLATTIGHEVRAGAFFTTAPGVHVNGRAQIGEAVRLGSNAATIERVFIADDVVVGAGACVINRLDQAGTYVGVPARRVV